jgi:hypothetical protein
VDGAYAWDCGEEKLTYPRILVRKRSGKYLLVKARKRWDSRIMIHFVNVRCGNRRWMKLDRDLV